MPKRIKIKQYPLKLPSEITTNKAEEKIIKKNIKEYNKTEAKATKIHQEYLERIQKEEKEAEELKERISKISNRPFTYDHNGKVLLIKRQGSAPFDLTDSKVKINPPPEMQMEDMGIISTQSIYKVEKMEFMNNFKFLEDF